MHQISLVMVMIADPACRNVVPVEPTDHVHGPTPTHNLHTYLANRRCPNGAGQEHYRAVADEAEPFNMSNLASDQNSRRMDYATTTTWGGFVPWVANAAVFVDVVVASNEYVPFPVIALVRSTSTHVPTVTAPTEATGLPEMAGLLPQTTVLSVQLFETRYQSPPRSSRPRRRAGASPRSAGR